MKTNARNLSQFVPNPLSSRQEQRILEKVLDRNEKPTGFRLHAPVLAGASLVLATALLVMGVSSQLGDSELEAPSIAAEEGGARWFATGEKRLVVVLQSGRQLELHSLTQVNVLDEQATRARLERGTVRCEGGAERLTIEAGNAEVYCDGQSLSAGMEIGRDGPYLTVEALSGPATVKYNGKLHSIAQGATWSTRKAPPESNSTPDLVRPSTPKETDASPSKERPSGTSSPAAQAGQLWKEAQDARLAGDAGDAARSFSSLITQFPGDSRAGLAGFELGRIQLDGLSNPAGALRAFDFAVQQGGGGFFVEDAAAGRVTALDRLGSSSACEQAKNAFLSKHSGSAHAPRIRGLCTKQ